MLPKKIIMARIIRFPGELPNEVHVTFEGGQAKFLFSYFPDVISFLPSDFIELTEDQAYELKNIRTVESVRKMLKFRDMMDSDLNGPLRVEHRSDGYYVVGEGMLLPIQTWEEGDTIIKKILARRLNNELPG